MMALASYTWSHAIDNVDPDIPGQNPNDANFTGKVENANAIFDQRQRLVLSGFYRPVQDHLRRHRYLGFWSSIQLHHRRNQQRRHWRHHRPACNQWRGRGRNAGRGNPIYDFSPFIERPSRCAIACASTCVLRHSTSSITRTSWAIAVRMVTEQRRAQASANHSSASPISCRRRSVAIRSRGGGILAEILFAHGSQKRQRFGHFFHAVHAVFNADPAVILCSARILKMVS